MLYCKYLITSSLINGFKEKNFLYEKKFIEIKIVMIKILDLIGS